MQHLIPSIPITGEPETDFGGVYRTVCEIANLLEEIQQEVGFDGIEISNDQVHLTLEGERVSFAKMDGRHVDSTLCLGDPL